MKFKIIQKNTVISVITVSLVVFLLLAKPVGAIDWVHTIIGGLASGIVSVLGWVLTQLIKVLVFVAGYNHFIKSAAVSNGWVIARDIANMFFIVILLVIAFATILQVEQYNYKKWLPKLILMAVLINFSKTICGILIDIAQVVMLTFVNAFIGITAGNLTTMLGIKDWQSLQTAPNQQAVSGWEAASVYMLAVIYVIIALIVIAAMVGMLVMRIIMIWVYVVLSPFAYLLAAFPGGQKYASQWWGDFTKNLIVGPVLAFFIWLSFASLVDLTSNSQFSGIEDFRRSEQATKMCQKNQDGACVFGTSELMLKFIISIAMLIGGMKIAQEIGGAAGGVAGKIAGKGKNLALMGAGAVGGAMGYNFAKRRFSNWKAERKKNIQQKSDLVYENIKGGVKGVGSGLYRASGVKDAIDNSIIAKIIQQKKAKKQEKRRERQARFEAFESNKYVDASGKTYDYDSSTNRYKDKSGAFATNSKGEYVTRMTNAEASFRSGMSDSMTKARALKNQINEEKMSKEQKIFEGAGSSVNDLKRVMNNSTESQSKRMAAALQLAIKEGFKNKDLTVGRKEVVAAKNLIGNNAPMLKKFEDQVNKRFAALNFDLSTPGGADAYKEAMADGSVNGYRQDASTYDENTIRALKDYSGKEFSKNINSTMSESKDHRNNVTSALNDAKNTDINNGQALFDSASGEINEFAKILARSGEVIKAFNNTTTPGQFNFDKTSEDALVKFLATAKSDQISNINSDMFEPDKLDKILSKDGITSTPLQRTDAVHRINFAMTKGVETSKLTTMERSDQNPELVRRIIGAIDKYGTNQQKQEISSNNILKNVKPTAAI